MSALPGPRRCSDCAGFNLPGNHVSRGITQHYANSPYHHFCNPCNLHFIDVASLQDHQEANHQYCRKCDIVFTSNIGLYEHYRQASVHQGPYNPIACPFPGCGKRFEAQNGLDMHLRYMHRSREVLCPLADQTGCRKKFIEVYDALKHIEARGCYVRGAVGEHTHNTITVQRRDGGRRAVEGDAHTAVMIAAAFLDRDLQILPYLSNHNIAPHPLHAEYIQPGFALSPANELNFKFGCSCGKKFKTYSSFLQHIVASHSDAGGRQVGDQMLMVLQARMREPIQAQARLLGQ